MARRKKKRSKKNTYGGLLAAVRRTNQGRRAIRKFKQFWGIKKIPSITCLNVSRWKGPKVLTSLGSVPEITLADGPKGRHKKTWKLKRPGLLVTNGSGRRLYILSNGRKRVSPKFLGWVKFTEYIPSRAIERLGSGKSNKRWRHEMGESGGTWPKAHMDSSGNITYGKGTYKVGKWIYD